ncbi:hypothetical protein MIND_00997100 [Mycena indigotica]|uniref:DUF6534 domain-containing protein n=1 Tax=Mycena indigotica TaxID=2126181 RepID=A0A8H6S7S5_9AGAR|nr:uncharacterized protein MIND_00997100 [Mycena indigotica]KAF7294605.1 hypothetical protein MIND_00997100 [Mycena indigotica]
MITLVLFLSGSAKSSPTTVFCRSCNQEIRLIFIHVALVVGCLQGTTSSSVLVVYKELYTPFRSFEVSHGFSNRAIFIGAMINWFLFGALFVQIYIYYTAFPKDPRWAKIGVAAVLFLELVETLSDVHDLGRTFGWGWGDMESLDVVGWAWFSVPVLSPIIASIGQSFFSYRIYLIGQTICIPILICLTSLLQLGAGLWSAVNICLAGRFSLLQSRNDMLATTLWLASTSLCDLIIVFGMVYYLSKSRQREFGRMNSTISRIIYLTVETGAVCTIVVLVDLYLVIAFKSTNIHLALCMELSKIYSNSILLIFNSRATISHQAAPDTNLSIHVSGMEARSTNTATLQFALRTNTRSSTTSDLDLNLSGGLDGVKESKRNSLVV